MRGKIEGAARASARALWARQHVPGYIAGEVRPLSLLLARNCDLVLVDVGANKGFYAKAFLECFKGRVNQVYLLDPSPQNFEELTNVTDSLLFDAVDRPLIRVSNVGAGSAPGTMTLYTDEDGSPMASLYPHKLSGADGSLVMGDDAGGLRSVTLNFEVPVTITTIDEFLEANGIAHVDVLKIDTEGHEFQVLLGSASALRSGKVDVVFFEFGNHQVEARNFFVDFFTFFRDVGFEMFYVADNRLEPIPKYTYRFENFSGVFNFAARRIGAERCKAPDGFTEQGYLDRNPDVAAAVECGAIGSGFDHWIMYGKSEGRAYS